MKLKDKLPVSYLLFTKRGRINRLTYWTCSVFIWSTFYVLYYLLENVISTSATWIIYPLLFWALGATATKRLHDINLSGRWLFTILIPVFGPIFLIFILGFRRGNIKTNRFGSIPGSAPDYFVNPDPTLVADSLQGEKTVDDVTQLNPIKVAKVETPTSVEELQTMIAAESYLCIGGGRFSMGGQTASLLATHIDMRKLNRVIDFSAERRIIRVEAGIRWCDIQHHVDPFDLSVKIMQTYSNFTVGGSLSVNCHGRYVDSGPLILSVKSLDVVLANGELVHTSPTERPHLFFACVGCYNAVAVIVRAELELAENVAVKRNHKKMRREEYKSFFTNKIGGNEDVIFHNGDIYPPNYKNVRSVSWIKTTEKPTVRTRLMPLANAYPIERYFIGAFSSGNFGKWRREFLIDPILYTTKKIHWRNYEAGYDVLELEPESRKETTYVLQEYFVPINEFDVFSSLMSEIFIKHKVNVINVSIRHAYADIGSLLAWAREEVFAFVVWYKQGTSETDKDKVGVWTREMIDAVLSIKGAYYLPYQAHATSEQFHKAYPRAKDLFEMKKQLDPGNKFRNVLWNMHYKPS